MVEQFCNSILQLDVQRSKALANLVMGLSSQDFCKSVVEISLSPCYHYQYSSINKAICELFSEKEKSGDSKAISQGANRQDVEKKFID